MSTDRLLIIIGWTITTVLLLLYVPKARIRQAFVIFMFKQLITWLVGLVVVELRLIEYPVRSFAYASKTSFDFEYFIYPAFCVLFNLYYPEGKSFLKRSLHYIYYCSALTAVEVVVEKYTDILHYVNWAWYTTFITLFLTFFMSRQFYKWFFKIKENQAQSN
ncbi:MAG: hypothetical protein A2Y23_07760 [Clostridiales bacterium GWB2_37_7]|nr:MAG: hypothetical protein A2Y23_07760 [Clostridiales bacterium GWB2_37_7]